jgi:hypothetical protein
VRAAIAGASGVLAKSAAPRTLLASLRGAPTRPLDPHALRAAGARLDPDDLPILGMLSHGVEPGEVATTLGIEPEWLVARRAAMLLRLSSRRPVAAA